MGKLITISIPTWNRSSLLHESLSMLSNQISRFRLESKIQLLVSDNASDDDTQKIVQQFQQQCDFISYFRNEKNIGAKSNVLKSMERADTPCVMFLGDDDRIRDNVLPEIINLLEEKKDTGVVIDSGFFKKNFFPDRETLTTKQLVEKYYWNAGNAGFFIIRAQWVKHYLKKYGYNFFNECWPQTQIMILGLTEHSELNCYQKDLKIHSGSIHTEVMMYSSFYLWRTMYLELINSIEALRAITGHEIADAGRRYLVSNVRQFLFNVLQCGVFVDSRESRHKTIGHIRKNFSLLNTSEKKYFRIILFVLWLPVFISRPLSNVFIFLIRGRKGLAKKNEFVLKEIRKAKNHPPDTSGSVRQLQFETD